MTTDSTTTDQERRSNRCLGGHSFQPYVNHLTGKALPDHRECARCGRHEYKDGLRWVELPF